MINQNALPKGSSTTIKGIYPRAVARGTLLLCALVLCALTSVAQPVWSPAVRSQREMQWLTDSLKITKTQETKITPISLQYQKDMDQASQKPDKKKRQAKLEKKKDAEMKSILSAEQYKRYYKREELIRKQAATIYKDRQPM